eukprot:GCRY01004311.1.p1 GENE.GCRY01004311.1~~GCRY01004311.1.p1  ORF type:complete len:335 (-),score=20.59 GCRY01004311.1:94-1098(-)
MNRVEKVWSMLFAFGGPFFVILAVVLELGIPYLFLSEVVPFIQFSSFIWKIIFFAAFWLTSFSMISNYVLSVVVFPQNSKKQDDCYTPNILLDGHLFCDKCYLEKPPRTHHCSVCKRCILRMDHHCPWIANCVGHHNAHYFFLFIFYATVLCFFIGYFTFTPLVSYDQLNTVSAPPRQLFEFIFLISTLFGVVLCYLAIWNCYFALTNQTYIEYLSTLDKSDSLWRTFFWRFPGKRNIYDLGYNRNLRVFFNLPPCKPLWYCLLPSFRPAHGDGAVFETAHSNTTFSSSNLPDVFEKPLLKLPSVALPSSERAPWKKSFPPVHSDTTEPHGSEV